VAYDREFKIAVLGSASEAEDSDAGRKAFTVGRAVARSGGILLTGGCPGLPHAAVSGARSSGGLTIAVSPALNLALHVSQYCYPPDSSVIMYTGMGTKGRNVILVRSADACLYIGGGIGTLNEFTIAFDELGPECAMGVLAHSGGLSDELPQLVSAVGRTPAAALIVESDPEKLVDRVLVHIRRNRADMP